MLLSTFTRFAQELGVRRDTLNKWMTTVRQPDPETTVQLARRLGNSTYALIGLRVGDLPAVEAALLFAALPVAQQAEVLADLRRRSVQRPGPAENVG